MMVIVVLKTNKIEKQTDFFKLHHELHCLVHRSLLLVSFLEKVAAVHTWVSVNREVDKSVLVAEDPEEVCTWALEVAALVVHRWVSVVGDLGPVETGVDLLVLAVEGLDLAGMEVGLVELEVNTAGLHHLV